MGSRQNNVWADELEKPGRQVTLSRGFWISEAPITIRQYATVLSIEPTLGTYEASLDSPASQHAWEEAVAFCEALDKSVNVEEVFDNISAGHFSLPTEAQWEYACRAGTTTRWHFGRFSWQLGEYAWYKKHTTRPYKLPAVKQKKPNPWGIYDLYGMVYEWCVDDLLPYDRIQEYIDPVAKTDDNLAKIIRGGAIDDAAEFCTSRARRSLASWNSDNDLTGIRVVFQES